MVNQDVFLLSGTSYSSMQSIPFLSSNRTSLGFDNVITDNDGLINENDCILSGTAIGDEYRNQFCCNKYL